MRATLLPVVAPLHAYFPECIRQISNERADGLMEFDRDNDATGESRGVITLITSFIAEKPY